MFPCLIILYYTTRSQQRLPFHNSVAVSKKRSNGQVELLCLVLGINEEQNHNQSDSAVAVRSDLGLGGLGV